MNAQKTLKIVIWFGVGLGFTSLYFIERRKKRKQERNFGYLGSSRTVTYEMAIDAIGKSGMLGCDKAAAIPIVNPDGTSGYFDAIVGLCKSSMSSSERAEAIISLSNRLIFYREVEG